MPKNPNNQSKPVKGTQAMNGAMKLFLAGLVAELYLLIIRRFYVTGTAVQMIAWFDYLLYLAAAGGIVFLAGLVLAVLWRKDPKKRTAAWYITGAGAFLGGASGLIRLFNAPAVSLLTVVVFLVMLLGILWQLYDRECAYALTILGLSLVALWVCRKELSSMYLGVYVRVIAVAYILVLAVLALLARRAVSKEVGDKIFKIVNDMENRAKAIGCDMRKGQPTPGNIAGGLSSIEEKTLGAIVKSGTRPIQGVLDYPEYVTNQKGLWIKDTPGREPEILTGMAATGAQFMMFSTGRGAPQGFPCMPVVKICGNPITYPRMEQDMDLNAGLIITGDKTIEQVGEEAFAKALRTLSGEMTKNEAIQYVSSIDIHCLGPVI